ncbi:MAG TPA: periplasmic heavy metal sensor [Candidatus Aminicenantes bacterium]|nr:periplasmic heavy metal sensor [Candidatus Aminicenantes bacterium]
MKANHYKRLGFVAAGLAVGALVLNAGVPQEPPAKEKIRENISALRLMRMTQALDLTEEEAAKIFPALSRVEKEKMEIQREIGVQIRDLRSLAAASRPGESEILEKIGTIRSLREKIRQKDDEFERFLESRLSPVQQAKYMIFTVDFYRGLGEHLRRARGFPLRQKRNP